MTSNICTVCCTWARFYKLEEQGSNSKNGDLVSKNVGLFKNSIPVLRKHLLTCINNWPNTCFLKFLFTFSLVSSPGQTPSNNITKNGTIPVTSCHNGERQKCSIRPHRPGSGKLIASGKPHSISQTKPETHQSQNLGSTWTMDPDGPIYEPIPQGNGPPITSISHKTLNIVGHRNWGQLSAFYSSCSTYSKPTKANLLNWQLFRKDHQQTRTRSLSQRLTKFSHKVC